jgi:hypothetical protein
MVFLAMLVYQRNTFNIGVVGMDHQPLPRLVFTGLLMLQIRTEKNKFCVLHPVAIVHTWKCILYTVIYILHYI